MRKALIITIFILAALFLANTALGKYVGRQGDVAMAGSGQINVEIVEMTNSRECENNLISNVSDATSSVNETLENLAPGDDVTLSYKIINSGGADALLNGVNISVKNNELNDCFIFNWTITQYEDNIPVKSASDKIKGTALYQGQCLADVSFAQIVLDCDSKTNDYCMLEVNISFDDDVLSHTNISHETVFTITPLFIQN